MKSLVIKTARLFTLGLIAVFIAAGCSPEAKVKRYLSRAERHYDEEDFDKAVIEYLNVLRIDRENEEAIAKLADIFYQRKEYAQAIPLLEKMKQTRPDDLENRRKLMRIYRGGRAFTNARAEARYLLSKDLNDEEALLYFVSTSIDDEQKTEARELLATHVEQFGETVPALRAESIFLIRERKFAEAEEKLKSALELDSDNVGVHLELGNLYWRQNDLESAEPEFEKAADLSAAASLAHFTLADYKIKTGALPEGRLILEEIMQQAPEETLATSYLAHLAFAEKKYGETETLIEEVLSKDPTHAKTRVLKGRLLMANTNLVEAVSVLNSVSKENPNSSQAHYWLGVSQLLNQEASAAYNALEKAVRLDRLNSEAVLLLSRLQIQRNETAQAEANLALLMENRPRTAQAYLQLAEIYRLQNQPARALQTYEKLETIYPENHQSSFLKGLNFLEMNQPDKARQSFLKSLELSEEDFAPAIRQLVRLDIAENRTSSALSRLDALIQEHPESAELHHLKYLVHFANNDAADAEKSLLESLNRRPDYRESAYGLAKLLSQNGRHEEAVERIDAFLDVAPNDPGAMTLKAMSLENLGRYEEAISTYERLIEINPDSAVVLNNLAYLYLEKLGRVDEAYEKAVRAEQLTPANPMVLDTVGWAMLQRGDYSSSLAKLTAAADGLPQSGEVRFHLGVAHYMCGEEEEAKVALEAAVKAGNAVAYQDEAKKRLKVLEIDASAAQPNDQQELERLIRENPKDLMAHVQLGRLHRTKNEFPLAKQHFTAARQINRDAVLPMVELAELEGLYLDNCGQALQLARQARDANLRRPGLDLKLGRVSYHCGDLNAGILLLNNVTNGQFEEPEAKLILSKIYFAQGKLEQAGNLSRNASIAGSGPWIARQAGAVLAIIRFCEDASLITGSRAELESALESLRDDLMMRRFTEALINEADGNRRMARDTHEEILNQRPGYAPSMKRLIVLMTQTTTAETRNNTELERIKNLAETYVDNIAPDAQIQRILGITLFQLQDYASTIRSFEGIYPNPNDRGHEYYYYVGISQFRMGQEEKAKSALEKALQLNPQHPLALEAKDILGRI